MHNNRVNFLNNLVYIEKMNSYPKWKRISKFFYKRLVVLLSQIIFKLFHRGLLVKTKTFFETPFFVWLPSSADVYLLGGRSHSAEIRLSKFLIRSLQEGDVFFDVGAHFGTETLLGSVLVGESGRVYSFEPSNVFDVLDLNRAFSPHCNIYLNRVAVSDSDGTILFNSLDLNNSEGSRIVFSDNSTNDTDNHIEIKKSISLDSFCVLHKTIPRIVKIDVEGFENLVIRGLRNVILKYQPIIVMEVWDGIVLPNVNHKEAVSLLQAWGYKIHHIQDDGSLLETNDAFAWCRENKSTFDNVVFLHS